MTKKDRTKTLARQIQKATGASYAACRQQVEKMLANDSRTADEVIVATLSATMKPKAVQS